MKYGSPSFAVFLVDGYDLLAAKVQGVTRKVENLLQRTDGLGDSWRLHSPTGMRRGVLTQEGAFFEDSAASMHAAFKAVSTTAVRILCAAYGGNTIGKPFFGAEGALLTSYEPLAINGELTKANAAYEITGQVDDGVIVQEWEAKTADWNTKTSGEQHDNAASSNNGAVGYLQVSAFSGFTGMIVKIRHSADDVTYADLITFTNVTAGPVAERLTVAGTVNRYTCVDGDVTGSGSATVFVGLKRGDNV